MDKTASNPQFTKEMKARKFYADWHGIPYGDLTEEDENKVEMMQQYASEASRERAIKFINHLIDSDISIDLSTNTLELFDKWKSKQEDKDK